MKTNKYQRQKYTLMKRYNKIWTQIKAKKCKLNPVAEKKNTRWNDKSEKRSVLGKWKTEHISLQTHDVIQPFIEANQTKENWKQKQLTL
jgi:hypothetical protein